MMGRPRKPNNAIDPWVRQLFDWQDYIKMPARRLSYLSGISMYRLNYLRNPGFTGKQVSLAEIKGLCSALGATIAFDMPRKATPRSHLR